MFEKMQEIISRFEDLDKSMQDIEIINNQEKITELAIERKHLEPIAEKAQEYVSLCKQIEDDKEIIAGDDQEMKELALEEIEDLKTALVKIEDQLKVLMIPIDPNDTKNIIIEIRGGTGGDEAALFAADLYRVYIRFAERNNWNYEVMSLNETGIGGFKEVVFAVQGKGAYGLLKFESGVHRVQRVPKTETGGRVHTSAATVAILPEAEEADVEVLDSELKIDTFRASGAGGQHVNKTESAIRITHLPTGLVVTCQDESSQHKNKAAALKVLRSRLLANEQNRIASERAESRKSMVSTGDRSAKIRTYNFPQGRITDHRINYTSYHLDAAMDGDIGDLIEKLKLAEQQTQLASAH